MLLRDKHGKRGSDFLDLSPSPPIGSQVFHDAFWPVSAARDRETISSASPRPLRIKRLLSAAAACHCTCVKFAYAEGRISEGVVCGRLHVEIRSLVPTGRGSAAAPPAGGRLSSKNAWYGCSQSLWERRGHSQRSAFDLRARPWSRLRPLL